MTAQVLIVGDVLTNRKLLEARLEAEYFSVRTASNSAGALDMCSHDLPDVILLDVMMPGTDGFEACRLLKSDSRARHVPIVIVTALDHPSDLLKGLEAGADDFLTKPVDSLSLITRIKTLARLKLLTDEVLVSLSSDEQIGCAASLDGKLAAIERRGRVLLIEDREAVASRIVDDLRSENEVVHEIDPARALPLATSDKFDLLIISLSLRNADSLRLCSELRSLGRRHLLPILVVAGPGDEARLTHGLDMGVNDYVERPVNAGELLARTRALVRRKLYADYLRSRLEKTVEMAVMDPLTELHNRRYLTRHMQALFDESMESSRPLSILLIDVDRFKSINDSYGHDAGDDILRELAARLRSSIRGGDLACRYGGEEFVVLLPDTTRESAYHVGERVRQCIAAASFVVSAQKKAINVTASIGVAAREFDDATVDVVLRRADQALYNAKRAGRDRVVTNAV